MPSPSRRQADTCSGGRPIAPAARCGHASDGTELTIHASLEEEILYPAARDALGDKGHELLDEAEVEHATAKDLIAQLESASPGDELYDAKVPVLGEYVKHHVKEEHDEMFPKLRKSGLDLKSLGAQLRERRAALLGDA